MVRGAIPSRAMENSRTTQSGAGWACARPGAFRSLLRDPAVRLSWLRPSVLWRARNHVLAMGLSDPTDDERLLWMDACAGRALTIDRTDVGDTFAALVIGDTGEGDASQFAVVPPLLAAGADTAFLIVASDVIYPAGDAADYPSKFYEPYARYAAPIYAIPGNHDWYDGLYGFMRVFCGVTRPYHLPHARPFSLAWVRNLLWRRPQGAEEQTLARYAAERPPAQPAPYFVVTTPALDLVCIDTGIRGRLDRAQGEWLRRIAHGSPRAKVLITGKPLIVDNTEHPCPIEGGGTVAEIVSDPAAHFVAAIGGDTHNYQRYPVRLADGRTLQYIVSGGGGAFMHATHTIPRVTVRGVREDEFRCYPLRGDSLAAYSRVHDRMLARIARFLALPYRERAMQLDADEAVAIMSERIGITPVRPSARGVPITARGRRIARLLTPVVNGSFFHRFFSEILDWNDPPFFKHFLRLDVSANTLRIRCMAATGCGEQEDAPPVEDECVIDLA